MPYTYEDFHRDYTIPFIESLPMELRLKGIPPSERLKGLPPSERLKGLPPSERLKGLAPSEIEAYLLKLKKDTQSVSSPNFAYEMVVPTRISLRLPDKFAILAVNFS